MPKIFLVGGAVRDKILGLDSKDMDYVFVLDNPKEYSSVKAFEIMREYLQDEGYTIFLESPEHYTIRAKFPKNHPHAKLTADFVVARHEIGYKPGTRSPILIPGTLEQDLIRRDFTINAMAMDDEGNIIDPFGGKEDLKKMKLKTPISPEKSFNDDPLRILRAIRFRLTKHMEMDYEMDSEIMNFDYNEKMKVVSPERIREELLKCFKQDTFWTLNVLMHDYPKLARYIFLKTSLRLDPTFKS